MSKFELTFHLKQHTPLIHFQHRQPGATLRATELKPKLDKFIIKKMGGKESMNEEWFIDEKKKALNYKVRVKGIGEPDFFLILSYFSKKKLETLKQVLKDENLENVNVITDSQYFAMNDKVKVKRDNIEIDVDKLILGIMHNNGIEIRFKTFNPELKEVIENYFDEFLCEHNFGNRQNKGFGCFTKNNMNVDAFEAFLKKNYDNVLKFKTQGNNNNDEIDKLKSIFREINKIYKKMKNDPLSKTSFIKEIYEKKKINWEKEIIRDYFIINQEKKEIDLSNDSGKKYVRALLGLANQYIYPKKQNNLKDDTIVRIEDSQTKIDNEKIERFKSPLTFKVFDNNIYILFEEFNKKILDHEFTFFIGNDNSIKTEKKLKIKTPGKFYYNDLVEEIQGNTNWRILS